MTEVDTVEGRLAEILEDAIEVRIDGYRLSHSDLQHVIIALHAAASIRRQEVAGATRIVRSDDAAKMNLMR